MGVDHISENAFGFGFVCWFVLRDRIPSRCLVREICFRQMDCTRGFLSRAHCDSGVAYVRITDGIALSAYKRTPLSAHPAHESRYDSGPKAWDFGSLFQAGCERWLV